MAQWESTIVSKTKNLTSIPIEHQAMELHIQMFADFHKLLHPYQINENTLLNKHMRYLKFLIIFISYFNIYIVKFS